MPSRKVRDPWVVRMFREADMFGHRVNFNVNGEDAHRTCWGSCVTILIFFQLAQVLVYLLVDIVVFDLDRPMTTILYPNHFGEKNQPLQ